jgi:anti-sigma regulatory factor (Ser/Thr protein kinase)
VSAQLRTVLAADGRAAGQARSFIAEALRGSQCAALSDTAELLVTELVSNAVRHGGPPVELEVRCEEGRVAAYVQDASKRLPVYEPEGPSLLAEGGRGIQLVDALAARWGADVFNGRKRMWFVLEMPAG